MSFELKILGTNAATPAHHRNQTAQLLKLQNKSFLIDCGEGTQMQLAKYRCPKNKISHIFISHLHGDHYLGLMGLISTMHLNRRSKDLTIYGPRGLDEIISLQLKYSQTILNFKLHFHEVDTTAAKIIYDDSHITVQSIPLNHRVECSGFLFREKEKKRRLIKEKINHEMTNEQKKSLKNGEDVYDSYGKLLYENKFYTLAPKRSCSYAYCSDTKYDENIIEYICGVDLLYHEATFLHELVDRAEQTYHSTALQAATIAKKANVKKLVIGHFSTRYKNITPLLDEATSVFPNTTLAIEGNDIIIDDL